MLYLPLEAVKHFEPLFVPTFSFKEVINIVVTPTNYLAYSNSLKMAFYKA